MKRKVFSLLLIIILSKHIYSQITKLGSWNVLNIKYNHSSSFNFFIESQVRSVLWYNYFHYYEYKAGVNYSAQKNVKLTLAGGNYQTYKDSGNFQHPKNNDEIRLWPQLTLYQDLFIMKIEQRYRYEMRWTLKGYRNRFRYRLGISYNFGKENKGFKPWQFHISNELFFGNIEPYFERNRLQLALQYKFNKNVACQLGYLYQFDYKIFDETGKDFMIAGIYFEFSRKNIEQLLRDVEIKDN
ncbi:MAG: DUF2490 domain-containing protein [Bacteroidales bacterium]|nr:DUF2490 domain-containing protein [Bacteroidales bacterium]